MVFLATENHMRTQYQNIGTIQPRKRWGTVLSSVIIVLSIAFLLLSAWNFHHSRKPNDIHTIYINPRQKLIHKVSDKFLSFGLDASLLRDMASLPILNDTFINLAQHLSPAFVRVGGTSADCLYFNEHVENTDIKKFDPVTGQDISNFTINEVDFENLYTFSSKAGLRMIFDLNVLTRNPDGTWNDSNAWDIISFARKRNMNLDWQLGNEPNSFFHVFNIRITAEQLAEDYRRLRLLLNKGNFTNSLLVGPEVNHVGDKDHMGEYYAKTFLSSDKKSVNYITWHQYYLNGREATVEDFINPTTFDYLPQQIKSMKEILQSIGESRPMWLSETSSAYGGGAPELSDRFVAGFLWLDKLGYSAAAGLNVVTRQSFFGGNYALVGPDLIPYPDWWVSVLYKQFVSEKVMRLISSGSMERIRLYAHCTPSAMLLNKVPALTIYGINIDNVPRFISLEGLHPVLDKNSRVFYYSLTADTLQSSEVKLNGKILKLQSDGSLPPFQPLILKPTQLITLPKYSIVFMIVHGVKIAGCSA